MPRPRPAPRPQPPAREKGGLWLYGRHAVAAALANPARRFRRILALADTASELGTLLKAARAALPPNAPEVVERRAFDLALPQGAVHQGMAAAVEPLAEPSLDEVLRALPPEAAATLVFLDQVTDPHNVGAILRSAAAFGAAAVIVPEHHAPPVTSALAKAASGALEAVPLVRVANLARALDQAKAAGFWTVGLAEDAREPLHALDLPARAALVLGAEGTGLRRLTRERSDFLARLPTQGAIASLNVSNAAAVALYELARRRGERR